MKNKEQKEKTKTSRFIQKRVILSLVFLLCLCIFFVTEKAHGATTCNCSNRSGFFGYDTCGTAKETESSDKCSEYCKSGGCGYYKYGTIAIWSGVDGTSQNVKAAANTLTNGALSDSNGKKDVGMGSALLLVFNQLLYAVFKLMGALVVIAGVIFDWAVNAKNFNTVMNMSSIKEGWRMVRDFLNLFFILVLLFSAFCTIFSVEKYHLTKKNILLTLVIMALLVNFSFPIARFVIDAGNIPMYFFFQAIGGDNDGITTKLVSASNGNYGIMKVILPESISNNIQGDSDQTLSLVGAIIFIFLFGITLLVIAVLFVVRLLILSILVILAPVGFSAAIFPSFSKYADMWWDELFKQSFFGTAMAFMLYISILIMNTAQNDVIKTLADNALSNQTGASAAFNSILVGGVTLAIPIALLWIGIIVSKKMGAAGAGVVVGQATKVAKWAGKKFSGYNAIKKQTDAFKASRKKREDEKNKHRWGGTLGDKLNKAQDTALGKIGFSGAKKRADKMRTDGLRKDVDDKAKELKDNGVSIGTMTNVVNNSFDATGRVKSKITESQAAHAKAYTNGLAGDLGNILAGAPPNVLTAAANIQTALGAVPPTTPNENDLRAVTAYMNEKSEEVMRAYIK